jgi:hypothetical protein
MRTQKRPNATEGRRLEKEAARKRVTRAATVRLEVDFGRWLRDCVAQIPLSPRDGRVWDVRLAKAMGKGVETDRTLRRYYDAAIKRPGPSSAYAIGWGLHDLGVNWCSGPLGLLAAGHTTRFLKLLASVAGRDAVGRECALRLIFAGFKSNAPTRDHTGRILSDVALRHKPRVGIVIPHSLDVQVFLRSVVEVAAANRDIIDEAWEAAELPTLPRDAAPDFRRALRVFCSLPDREDFRLALACAVIANYSLSSHKQSEVELVSELVPYSPMSMLRRLLKEDDFVSAH